MEPIKIVLGWPSGILSPNRRSHWAVVGAEKKRYRSLCELTTYKQCCFVGSSFYNSVQQLPGKRLKLKLVFFCPDKRKYDRDNLVARMKSGLDGVADALQINDRQFVEIAASVDDETVPGGAVSLLISEE